MINSKQINRWFFKNKTKFNQLSDDFIYLNNGTEGSMPDCVLESFKEDLVEWSSNPTLSYETDPILGKLQTKTREQIARFLDVNLNNICLTNNTTMGLSMVLTGLNFQSGDRVITTDHEHPAIISPLWMLKQRQGIDVEICSFPDYKSLKFMTPVELLDYLFPVIPQLQNAKALCASHIYSTHGVRLPLDKLQQRAKELNIDYVIIDGAQAVGMVDLSQPENSVNNCDFYAAPVHKWMNGPPGTGILYVREPYLSPPEFYPTLSHKMEDYMFAGYSEQIKPVTEALQVRGCQNTPSYSALLKLLQFYQDMGGQQAIENHILSLSTMVREFIISKSTCSMISPSDTDLQSGLVSFFPFDWHNPQQCFSDKHTVMYVNQQLHKKGVQVRYIAFPTVVYPDCFAQKQKPGQLINCTTEPFDQHYCIRVSTGLFNNNVQVETFKKVLIEVLSELSTGKRVVDDEPAQKLACCGC